MNVTAVPSDSGRVAVDPTFTTPLWPDPTPSTTRSGASRSTDAAAVAVIAGCRVVTLVTHSATLARWVFWAATVVATHASMALPGVSAIPTIAKPSASPSDAMRRVYSGS
jgi:hypothetical protein